MGRDTISVDYVIDNNRVSGMHASILKKGDAIFVRDESRNGTSIDGKKIPKNENVEITDGCEIMFSDEIFKFYID